MTTSLNHTKENIERYTTKINILTSLKQWLDSIAKPTVNAAAYGSTDTLNGLSIITKQLTSAKFDSLDAVFDPLDYVDSPNPRAKLILSLCEKLNLKIDDTNRSSLITLLCHAIACDLQDNRVNTDVITVLQQIVGTQLAGYQAVIAAVECSSQDKDKTHFAISTPAPAKKSNFDCVKRYICCCFFSSNTRDSATNDETQILLPPGY